VKALTLLVVTGVMAAGKSTVARLLAQRFERGVHVEADALQRMIVSGGVWVGEPGEPQDEAARQLRLRLRNMCLLGISFREAGFTAVLDDIILGERLGELEEDLAGVPFTLLVLGPSVESVLVRDSERDKPTQGRVWAEYLDGILRATVSGHGLWFDTSDQTPDETVDSILDRLRRNGSLSGA